MGPETVLEEKMVEHFPNLVKDIYLKIQAQQSPNRINMEKIAPMCIIVKLLRTKDQEKISKSAREKQHITYNDSNNNGLLLRICGC